MEFSVIIPVYACSNSINELTKRLVNSLEKLSDEFEIIFIADGSPENDWELVKDLSGSDKRIKGINFSRNFGQHYAIFAGLGFAKGEWVIVMDGDLQDQPEEINKLYRKAKEGYDIVFAQRKNRADNIFKRTGSYIFYRIYSYLTDTYQDSSIANFGIYKSCVISAILKMKDKTKYFPTMSQWVGFRKTVVPVIHSGRKSGRSAYTFTQLSSLAVNNIIAFSNKPLKLTIKLGFTVVAISIIMAIYYLIQYLKGDIVVLGYASLILSIWFLSGIIILILGIVGIYIGKTFEKVKDRPDYIISEIVNC